MRPRILVVEDDARIAAAARRALVYQGNAVTVAAVLTAIAGAVASWVVSTALRANATDDFIGRDYRPGGMGDDGPVLLGARLQMSKAHERGPAVGGRLTVWHGHGEVCLSLFPPGLAGMTAPLVMCPLGTAWRVDLVNG